MGFRYKSEKIEQKICNRRETKLKIGAPLIKREIKRGNRGRDDGASFSLGWELLRYALNDLRPCHFRVG
jgi:hypothetical protein